MYSGLVHAHSGLRWFALLALVLATMISASQLVKKDSNFPKSFKMIFGMNVGFIHLQAIIGVVLYFMSAKVQFSKLTMKTELFRFFTMEHPVMMLIAVVLITIGNAKAKRIEGLKKYKTLFIFNFIALVIVLASIPWPFRNLGAGWM